MAKIKSQETDLSFLFDNLWDVFSDISSDSEESSMSSSEMENYLSKETRLSTLAREKYDRVIHKIELSQAEEKLYTYVPKKEDNLADIVSRISKSFTRPLLRSMQYFSDEYANMLFSLVKSASLDISISDEVPKDVVGRLFSFMQKSIQPEDTPLCVTVTEEGYPPFCVYGMKNTTHPKRTKNVCFKDAVHFADLADLFSYLIVFAQVKSVLSSFNDEPVHSSLSHAYTQEIVRYRDWFVENGCKVSCESKDEVKTTSFTDVVALPILYPFMEQNAFLDKFFQDNPFLCCVKSDRGDVQSRPNSYVDIRSRYWESFPFCFLLDSPISYHALLRRKDNHFWVLPISSSSRKNYLEPKHLSLWASLYRLLAEEKNDIRESYVYFKDLDRTYAKSFMLKKNISDKVVKAMEASLFNRYFGFVEFDTDTDLEKVEEIAREFMALKETHLSGVNSSENAIRFRKLGNHKALGLYYPSIGCLCVDIHSPESLVHEYGHLIDYTNGCLSHSYEFSAIRNYYKMSLHSFMESDAAFKGVMNGSSKYNLSYYLKPTEIFARSFELYIAKCKGVTNSIVRQAFPEGIYPQDDGFLKLVSEYFDDLLGRLNGSPNLVSANNEKAASV